MTADTVELRIVLARARPLLAEVLARPGTRVVLLAGSRDPNAKVTLILLDDYGPAFAIKVPTTHRAQLVVRNEGLLLEALGSLTLGPLTNTLPRAVGTMEHEGLVVLVSTALSGVPMTVDYHAWRHTARRHLVRRDFAAAGAWLADLHTRTAGAWRPVTLLSDAVSTISERFPDHRDLGAIRRLLTASATRLGSYHAPRTVVHGDYWFGNLLVDEGRVTGVVDWESGALSGEPLRDVARFAVSYALYLDRHTRPGHRVSGHRGLRAAAWGAGIEHAMGTGWFASVVQSYLASALVRLGMPATLWRDVMIGGIAEVAATADHLEFAELHLALLARLAGGAPAIGSAVPGQRLELADQPDIGAAV